MDTAPNRRKKVPREGTRVRDPLVLTVRGPIKIFKLTVILYTQRNRCRTV